MGALGRFRGSAVRLALAGVVAATLASALPAAASAHTVTYDHYSLKLDGRRIYVWSGEFHYWRLPSPSLWRDVLEKMKAAGYNATSIYFDWGYHSPKPGVSDFSGVRDVDELLRIASQVGIYVIARPGPYINAETDSGGFPAWLDTQKGRARSSAPDYTAAYMEWLSHIDPIIARHQFTNGTGTVILYQVENEYGNNTDATYMAQLEQKIRADGITVPLTHNHCCGPSTWATGPGAVDLPGQDSYPQGFNCSNPTQWSAVPALPRFRDDAPIFTPEFQGGSFDPWGGPGYDKCRQLTGPDFEDVFYKENIADGATMQNFYMTYGGTSWGWLPDPQQVYTSYDYGAAIKEDRELTSKYTEMKRIGYMLDSVAPLTKTDQIPAAPATNPAIRVAARANPDDGTQFYELRHSDSTSTANDQTHISIDLSRRARDLYSAVPQQPGTSITLAGREAKLLIAGYPMDGQRLQYSTSELMTHGRIGDRDIALFYAPAGQDGETVLRYARRPDVTVLSGQVQSSWNAARGDLRLDYVHRGLSDVLIRPRHGTPLELLLASDDIAGQFWRQATRIGAVLVRGPELVRSGYTVGRTLVLTGDTAGPTRLEVFAPRSVTAVRWNARRVAVTRLRDGALAAVLSGPDPVTLPALGHWRFHLGSPETKPGFDDRGWQAADEMSTNNPTPPVTLPVLYADDYGFHHGDVWYRGHFTAQGSETGVNLSAITGRAGIYSAWLNGQFLGSTDDPTHHFDFPAGSLQTGRDNVLSVMVENMGHNEDFNADDSHKQPRGLTGVTLVGSNAALQWRIQGSLGGETLVDPTRGPMNTGGLYGERNGWSLPGFPDGAWRTVTLPHPDATPGESWYRTTFSLHLPRTQDVPVGIDIADAPTHHYRALIYVNGWLMGRYINDIGPEHSFPVPPGILRPDGTNTLAIAVWNEDAGSGGLGQVRLQRYANLSTSLRVTDVYSPGYAQIFPHG
ncbi:MAG: beta-galactosidase [Solirubrobacterales bacterium]|nr:beta-galactosidase [Solirubrobacterales bacterium]